MVIFVMLYKCGLKAHYKMLLVMTEAIKKKMLLLVFPTKPSEFVKLRAVTFDRKRGYQIAQY